MMLRGQYVANFCSTAAAALSVGAMHFALCDEIKGFEENGTQ